ncbi:MAG TPA: hypothetical protein IAB73_03955 [Candidatus Onthenecus intestinigallinarum]|uniref:Uncharacterized protein n=1 Tax=Candidatus Onthenecus intestinigallinarum TaxID=2840875 RepID=A0A9D0Z9A1_9FIRM|nr:hypothetical protein [Candidatus Onthenecus intestinigallinarum]
MSRPDETHFQAAFSVAPRGTAADPLDPSPGFFKVNVQNETASTKKAKRRHQGRKCSIENRSKLQLLFKKLLILSVKWCLL